MVKEWLLDIGYRMSKDNGYRMNTRQWLQNEYTATVTELIINDNGYTMNTQQWLQTEYKTMVTEWIYGNGYTMNKQLTKWRFNNYRIIAR